MYLYMYIYEYIYIYVYMCIYVYVYIYTYSPACRILRNGTAKMADFGLACLSQSREHKVK